MKRILSLLLAFALVLTMLPALPLQAEAKQGGKLVALTFDDGPSSKYTNQLLDGLKARKVPATFFFLGEMAEDNRAIVRRAYEEGHEIACHSWDHPNLTACSESEVKKQIENTFEELDRACGDEADYLVRPPYDAANQMVRDAVDAPLVYWSVDSEDWASLDAEKVCSKIMEDTYDGAIIRCHDIYANTITGVLDAVDALTEQGYEFVTVSELFRRRGRTLEDHKIHYNSNKNGTDYGPVPAPKISVTGNSSGVNTVTITCSDKNVPLYYTVDGSYPNQNAKRYTGSFTVPYGTKITAVAAWKLNGSRSALAVKTADQIKLSSPVITLNEDGMVVMTTSTAGASICYTTDNKAPNANSLPYTGPEWIPGGCFLRAVTVHKSGVSAETRAYLSEEGNLYYDIFEDKWYYEAMNWAHSIGILNGTAKYVMDPGGTVTRGMLVALLYRFSGDALEDGWTRTNGFKDVNQKYYYAEAIEWAYRNQIVDGYGPSAFGPDDVVTRQQMCKIVSGFLTWLGTPLHRGESCRGVFGDYDQLAPWAVDCVEAMVSAGLIVGDGKNLNPNAGTNRAQFCVVLIRLMEYIDNYVPGEPDHDHQWKLNKANNGSVNWASLTIREGETIELLIECTECGETAPVEWEADPDGVVLVEDEEITGILGGNSTLVQTVWEGVEYECLIYVREDDSGTTEHVHSWKLNKAQSDAPTTADVSIDVGEKFTLKITCQDSTCKETANVTWTADPSGVVRVEGSTITGVQGGKNARVRTQLDGITFECLVRVRKDTSAPTEPTEPVHVHQWKLNKATGGSETTGDVSINPGEWFNLRILCKDKDCEENAPVTWTPSKEGVVNIDGMRITGVKGGSNTTLTAQWEGVTYSCIVRVRKQTNSSIGPVVRE